MKFLIIIQTIKIKVAYMNIIDINQRIINEINYHIIDELSDKNLLSEYKKCTSVKNKINKLDDILKMNDVCQEKRIKIINDFIIDIIPSGTKGVIRGNKFNKIIKEFILDMKMDRNRFEICFEKQCGKYEMTEIPDWFIFDKQHSRVVIGMNQIDIWNGGQQLNRGSKYLLDNKMNDSNCKLLCVICNPITFVSNKSKVYKLFKIGYTNNTLCYIGNLESIITIFLMNQFVKFFNDFLF